MKNNPFKILGSYIGLIIGVILAYFIYATLSVLCEFGECKLSAYFLPIIFVILGFLIGWGVHILIKK